MSRTGTESNVAGGANIGLIDLVARYSFDHGFHVIVEGILYADRYGETLRRHATKSQAVAYGEAQMRDWYRDRDLLPSGIEQVIPVGSSLGDTVCCIMRDAGLAEHAELPCQKPLSPRQ